MAARSMFPAISPDGNLSRYLDQIRAFPMLEPNEEYMLAKAWKEKGDVAAALMARNSLFPVAFSCFDPKVLNSTVDGHSYYAT